MKSIEHVYLQHIADSKDEYEFAERLRFVKGRYAIRAERDARLRRDIDGVVSVVISDFTDVEPCA